MSHSDHQRSGSAALMCCAPPAPSAGGRCLPGSPRGSDGRMAEAGGPESAAARCLDESSDSEPEQEPGTPQKLIRKVSTSGQIRSKVKRTRTRASIRGLSVGQRLFPFSGLGHTAPSCPLLHRAPE